MNSYRDTKVVLRDGLDHVRAAVKFDEDKGWGCIKKEEWLDSWIYMNTMKRSAALEI